MTKRRKKKVWRKRTPNTRKMRRDMTGGKRGDGNQRRRAIRRPDPRQIRLGKPDPSLSAVAGLVMFGAFLRALGVDRALAEAFGHLKSGKQVVYPMAAQMRMLLDLVVAGEHRVFGLESLSADALFVRLCGGIVPSLDTTYRDLARFDEAAIDTLEEMMAQHGLARVRRSLKLRVAHLDIDTTVEPLFGEHDGALPGPNPHYHGRPRVVAVRSRERENGKMIYLWEDYDYTVQVFLTNDFGADEDEIAHRYDKRAGIEPLIGEWKSAWGIGKVPSTNFNANHAALLLKLLAHNLLRRYVEEHVPALRSWRAPWIRRAVILVPGRLTRSGRGWKIRTAPRPAVIPMLN